MLSPSDYASSDMDNLSHGNTSSFPDVTSSSQRTGNLDHTDNEAEGQYNEEDEDEESPLVIVEGEVDCKEDGQEEETRVNSAEQTTENDNKDNIEKVKPKSKVLPQLRIQTTGSVASEKSNAKEKVANPELNPNSLGSLLAFQLKRRSLQLKCNVLGSTESEEA